MKFQCSIRSLLVLASLAGIFILSGCWDRTEVNDLGIITGAAIDRYDSKQIELSLQIFVPGIASGGGTEVGQRKDTAKASTVVFSARGINIADALTRLQEKISRKLFWGHAEAIIFGEAEARHGIWQDVDYLMRSPQPRESAFIYVSQGKAREALEVQSVLERNTSEAYRELAKNKLRKIMNIEVLVVFV